MAMNPIRRWLENRRLRREWDDEFWVTAWIEVTLPQHFLDHVEAIRRSLPDDHDTHLAAHLAPRDYPLDPTA